MPQLTSNQTIRLSEDRTIVVEAAHFLEQLSQNLDGIISNALIEENNELAERLILPFMQSKKLAKALIDSQENGFES